MQLTNQMARNCEAMAISGEKIHKNALMVKQLLVYETEALRYIHNTCTALYSYAFFSNRSSSGMKHPGPSKMLIIH